jgi:hypothetical protein
MPMFFNKLLHGDGWKVVNVEMWAEPHSPQRLPFGILKFNDQKN